MPSTHDVEHHAASELFDRITDLCGGIPLPIVITAVATALSASVAHLSESPEDAVRLLERLMPTFHANIHENWANVEESRARGQETPWTAH